MGQRAVVAREGLPGGPPSRARPAPRPYSKGSLQLLLLVPHQAREQHRAGLAQQAGGLGPKGQGQGAVVARRPLPNRSRQPPGSWAPAGRSRCRSPCKPRGSTVRGKAVQARRRRRLRGAGPGVLSWGCQCGGPLRQAVGRVQEAAARRPSPPPPPAGAALRGPLLCSEQAGAARRALRRQGGPPHPFATARQ